MRYEAVEVAWPADVVACIRRFAGSGEVAWLDSGDPVAGVHAGAMAALPGPCGATSLVCRAPLAVIEQFDGEPARLFVGSRCVDVDANGWRLLRRVVGRAARGVGETPIVPTNSTGETPMLPLGPGWVGYIGYDAVRQLERLPMPRRGGDLGLPTLRMALFDRCIVLRPGEMRAFAVCAPWLAADFGVSRQPLAEFVAEWDIACATPSDAEVRPCGRARRPRSPMGDRPLAGLTSSGTEARRCCEGKSAARTMAAANVRITHETDRCEHEARVARAIRYIEAGDIYQVNLAQRIRLDGLGDALEHFTALRAANPAEYAALLRWPIYHGGSEKVRPATGRSPRLVRPAEDLSPGVDGGYAAVLSASPELFLRLRGREVLTSPIKGTRARGGDAAADRAAEQELLESAKDAAELAMIVDLHRNDLGRVCEYGSVRVRAARRLQRLPTVVHTVADVTGVLAAGHDPIDLLAACFPAGSITGVPKIRAMQIIDELESAGRGVYTGAIGWIGLGGELTFNVAIRTVQMRGATGVVWGGGGIVAESDPAAEYEETLTKLRGVLAAFGVGAAHPAPVGA